MTSKPARRLALAFTLTCLAGLGTAGPAAAASATLTITDAAGKSDPVAGVGRTFAVSGNVEAPTRLFVKFRPAGGAACAPSASTDTGTYLFSDDLIEGNYRKQETTIWDSGSGTFQFCIWLAASSTTTATPITQNVVFRTVTGTISATIAPIAPQPDQDATVTITGASEAPARVYAKIRPGGGAPCAASPASDPGSYVVDGTSVSGAFSLTATTAQDTPGAYLVCLWLADSSSSATPIAGPQPTTYSVVALPPPCIVPSLTAGTALSSVRTALTQANCTAGAQNYTPSRTYPRGTLIKLTPVAGTSLAPGAPVAVLISSGRPCRVPRVIPGMTISTARARLVAAGCTSGGTRRARSRRVRRGRVVAYSPSAGRVLRPRAPVTIVVSRGRR